MTNVKDAKANTAIEVADSHDLIYTRLGRPSLRRHVSSQSDQCPAPTPSSSISPPTLSREDRRHRVASKSGCESNTVQKARLPGEHKHVRAGSCGQVADAVGYTSGKMTPGAAGWLPISQAVAFRLPPLPVPRASIPSSAGPTPEGRMPASSRRCIVCSPRRSDSYVGSAFGLAAWLPRRWRARL